MMNHSLPASLCKISLFIALAATLLHVNIALAQDGPRNLRASTVTDDTIKLKWDATTGFSIYHVYVGTSAHTSDPVGGTSGTSYTIGGLSPETTYYITVGYNGRTSMITVTTEDEDDDDDESIRRKAKPPAITCPVLPARVVVIGYVENTQCQMVGTDNIGRTDLLRRGFIDAVDIWSNVPDRIDVCFRNQGSLVFLDAAYAPRMLMELESYQRFGMTCATINRAGTVALLRTGALAEAPAGDAATVTLPVFESIPLADCQIKLEETLFLRAEPAGEIIGLVWLNSEVQALEMSGYWYKVEFEGRTGYISRYHRRVLRGGCG